MKQTFNDGVAAILNDPVFDRIFDKAFIPKDPANAKSLPVYMPYSRNERRAFAALAHEMITDLEAGLEVQWILDLDGTLVPFKLKPADSRMDRSCHGGIVRLSVLPSFRAAACTGRAAEVALRTILAPGYEVRDSRGRILSQAGDHTSCMDAIGAHGSEFMRRDGDAPIQYDFGALTPFTRRFKDPVLALGHDPRYAGIHIENKHGAIAVNVAGIRDGDIRREALGRITEWFETCARDPDNRVEGGVPFRIFEESANEREFRSDSFDKAFGIRTFGATNRDALTIFCGDSFKAATALRPAGTDVAAKTLVQDKCEFARGRVIMVCNNRCDIPYPPPDAVAANSNILGDFMCYTAGQLEARLG